MQRRMAGVRVMPLSRLARELTRDASEADKQIDFKAAGLYLPGLQTVAATTVSAAVSVIACWLIPSTGISAVRTLALTATAGLCIVRAPVRLGRTPGVNTVFAALRPCCLIYVLCLVLEQLVHTCVTDAATYEQGLWRRVIYHVSMATLIAAGFIRAAAPRSESDVSFLVASAALLTIALLPPPAIALSGPLCSPPTVSDAGERTLRALAFSSVYTILVYSAAPISNNLGDTIVCVARSAAASGWVLGAVGYTLPLCIVQMALVLYNSLPSTAIEYDSVASTERLSHDLLSDAHASDADEHAQANEIVKRVMQCRDKAPHAPSRLDEVRSAERGPALRAGCNGGGATGGITFDLSVAPLLKPNGATASTTTTKAAIITEQRMAEIAASIV